MSTDLEDDEVYCRDCGAVINQRAEICPECGIRQQPAESPSSSEKNPGLAAAASFVIPGLGQVYNGQIAKGIIAGAVTVGFLLTGIGAIISVPIWIWLVYDAYKTAESEDEGGETVRKPTDELPAPDDAPAVIDHVLQWYVKTEAVGDGRVQFGWLRRRVREDGIAALSDASIERIEDVFDVYERRVGRVELQPTRERLSEVSSQPMED